MAINLDQLSAWVLGFIWPFARIAALVTAAPLTGARILPMRLRLVLALVLTWVILLLAGPLPDLDPLSPAGVLLLGNQILIGAAMGLALQIAFNALVVGGQIIGSSMGLGFASLVDPQNGIQVPLISQFYFLIGALIFLALDGHLVLVEVIATSFATLPLDAGGLTPALIEGLALWSGLMFSAGMQLALPVVSVILLTNLALGVATRAAPQLNVFALGFSITLMLGMVAMLLSLGHLGPLFSGVLDEGFAVVRGLVGAR
jgi:flagellar biosynthetic protein FliR